MKARMPRGWFTLPKVEKDAITKAMTEEAYKIVAHEEAQLQKAWIRFACVVLHDSFGFGWKRCAKFIGSWWMMYKTIAKFDTGAERDAFLADSLKFFGDRFPEDFIEKMEDIK